MEETLYQQSLRSLREIGEKTGEEMEEPVKILLKVEQILQEIEAHLTKEDPGQQNGGNERIKFVRDLCVFLMFGSDYVPLKARSAALSSTAREIETNEEKSKLPEVLVPVMKHMKYYLSLVDQAKKEVERLYKELTEKVRS